MGDRQSTEQRPQPLKSNWKKKLNEKVNKVEERDSRLGQSTDISLLLIPASSTLSSTDNITSICSNIYREKNFFYIAPRSILLNKLIENYAVYEFFTGNIVFMNIVYVL